MRNRLGSIIGALLLLALLSTNSQLGAQPIVTDREIDAAIERGVAFLLRSQHPHGHWDGGVKPNHSTLSGDNQGAITALAVWALRSCEFDGRDSRLKRGALWSLSCDVKGSYGRAMRACMLSAMPKDYREYLKRDTTWLVDALLPNGNFGPGKSGSVEDYGNHASGSYGMLGLRAAAEASLELRDEHWARIGKHWRDAQHSENGGWSYLKVGIPPETPTTDHWKHTPDGPMTAAAIAALYVSEYELYSRQMTGVGKNYISPNISNGIKFLKEHFDDAAGDIYFHYYNILLIGRSSGRRYFGDIDWFQRGAKLLLDEQNEDGSWRGIKGPATSTAFALLYLSRGMHPVIIGKLEFDGYWNNRPYDIGNFIHWLAPNLEWPLNWEIVNLKVGAAELLNIPALYMASHQAVKLSESEIATLRDYIHGGGMLVSTADAGGGGFSASINKLAGDLFPDYPMEKLEKDHPIQRLQYKPKRPKAIRAVSNGVRMLMMHIPSDISRSLQTRATLTDAESFETLGNIAIYATGQKRLKNRFDTLYVPPPQRKADRTVKVARLKYKGNWNPEPGAWPRFSNMLQERTGTALQINDVDPQNLDRAQHDVAVMTGTTEFSFSSDQLRGLRQFVDGGGLLIADAAGQSMPFATSFRQLVSELWQDRRLKRVRADGSILTGKVDGGTKLPAALYRRFLVLRVGRPDLPDLFTMRDEQGALRVAYSQYDLTTGLLGARAALIAGFHPDAATALTQNIIMTYLNKEDSTPTVVAQPLKDEGRRMWRVESRSTESWARSRGPIVLQSYCPTLQPSTMHEPFDSSLSVAFVEGLYVDYLHDPQSVAPDWRNYFEQLDGDGFARQGPSFRTRSLFNPASDSSATDGGGVALLQHRVDQLIRNYRVRGHIAAAVDPLNIPRPQPVELDPAFCGLSDGDLDRPFSTESTQGSEVATLRQILERLRNTYCRSIGVQFMHVDDIAVRRWLQERMEETQNHIKLPRRIQFRILAHLTDAVVFEEFIRRKFIGAKSFSLEGSETLIPLLDLAIERAGEQGIREIVLGMAHRGRLNVLANIMNKSARQIFREFADVDAELHVGRGDVKYHLGYSSDWQTASGKNIHLSLAFNPSHLEFINPVALGRMRAKQDRCGDVDRKTGMVMLVHGDAGFAGEGIVQETLNMSELAGYSVGGTLHVIVNNQIGFTTSPNEGRSSTYATDVAKMLQIPIFHVNGEDPEAVAQVVHLAMEFRSCFRRDVVIDMYCYRRRGHNESDEPAFTHPQMYRELDKRTSIREGYLQHLLKLGGITREEADWIAEQSRSQLETELAEARSEEHRTWPQAFSGIWSGYYGGPASQCDEPATSARKENLSDLLAAMAAVPDDFHPHPKIERWLKQRSEMAQSNAPLDWAAAEALAIATLSQAGHPVRLSGQDSARGTFSHRHSVLHDATDGHTYVPLQNVPKQRATVEIYNSPLSEVGVLGFEYGYSLDCPEGMILWEAQFGDFVNAAQVIIDQFITSAEDKWHRLSGIVLLLPHGFEGQGPEHSSARLERFLVLAAEDNIQVVNPTTPGQYYHLLRSQVLRHWRKPLVVMTPKSLLRHRSSVSSLEDLANGSFQRVIGDAHHEQKEYISHVVLCCGKIYYDLIERREALARNDVAIVRIEQLYPFPKDQLMSALAPYADGTTVLYVQEEPENMGAWRYLHDRVAREGLLLGRLPLSGLSRPESASPATGSHASHAQEQLALLDEALRDRHGRK